MLDFVQNFGTFVAIAIFVFVALLAFGANFAPAWAKSHAFLFTLVALGILGSNALV